MCNFVHLSFPLHCFYSVFSEGKTDESKFFTAYTTTSVASSDRLLANNFSVPPNPEPPLRPLDASHIVAPLLIWVPGTALSLLAFLVELVVRCRCHTRTRDNGGLSRRN